MPGTQWSSGGSWKNDDCVCIVVLNSESHAQPVTGWLQQASGAHFVADSGTQPTRRLEQG